eukprot:360663-Chlamydomonas_euryale.AAC.10
MHVSMPKCMHTESWVLQLIVALFCVCGVQHLLFLPPLSETLEALHTSPDRVRVTGSRYACVRRTKAKGIKQRLGIVTECTPLRISHPIPPRDCPNGRACTTHQQSTDASRQESLRLGYRRCFGMSSLFLQLDC